MGDNMESVEEIKRRLNKENVKEGKIIVFFNVILVMCLICLCGLIYCKNDENGLLIKKLFGVDVSFKQFNENINTAINNLFKIEQENSEDDKLVSKIDIYHNLGNNNYSTDDKVVRMLDNGKVVISSYQNDYKYFIVIAYENNVNAIYTFIDETTLSVNSELNSNDVIGVYNGDYFNCVLKKGESIISYNEFFE